LRDFVAIRCFLWLYFWNRRKFNLCWFFLFG